MFDPTYPPTPATDFAVVTPHDSTDLTKTARGLYVGSAGNVAVVTLANTAVVFAGVPAGAVLPVVCRRVNATGTNTTANTIVALY